MFVKYVCGCVFKYYIQKKSDIYIWSHYKLARVFPFFITYNKLLEISVSMTAFLAIKYKTVKIPINNFFFNIA